MPYNARSRSLNLFLAEKPRRPGPAFWQCRPPRPPVAAVLDFARHANLEERENGPEHALRGSTSHESQSARAVLRYPALADARRSACVGGADGGKGAVQ